MGQSQQPLNKAEKERLGTHMEQAWEHCLAFMPPCNHIRDLFWVGAQIAVKVVLLLPSCQSGEGRKIVEYVDTLALRSVVREK